MKNSISATIQRIEREVSKLQSQLLGETTKLAKEIIDRYPFVTSYCQAMGSATFDVVFAGKEFMISLNDDHRLRDIENYVEINDLNIDRNTSRLLHRFSSDCDELCTLHQTWDDHCTGSLAGEAVKIDKDGTVSSQW